MAGARSDSAPAAARGQLTKAQRDGNADKIAAARRREAEAYAEFDRIGRDSIEQRQTIIGAGLGQLGGMLDQMGRTWDAEQLADPEPDSTDEPAG